MRGISAVVVSGCQLYPKALEGGSKKDLGCALWGLVAVLVAI